ncbi:MAG: hypothetical protein HUU29_09670 [Planctomycetaceae bacterium]|nr:hypothetical protein [Planctomycetaceae bacterium]
MSNTEHDTRRVEGDGGLPKRKYTVTSDTMKKIKWVQSLLQAGNPSDFTIRGLAAEVKRHFGTSMNTNLLAEILQSSRDGDFDKVSIELSRSKRGRPTTLSPSVAARRDADRRVRHVTDTLQAKPEHLVFATLGGGVEILGFANVEEANTRIKELLAEGLSLADIAYYKRGRVRADFNVSLDQPAP